MTAASKLLITGRSESAILSDLEHIKQYWKDDNVRVEITGNDGSMSYDYAENIAQCILSDHEGYIKSKLLKKGKILKTDGECNLWIVDDPFKPIPTDVDYSRDYRQSNSIKFRRGSNYTKPKKRNRK